MRTKEDQGKIKYDTNKSVRDRVDKQLKKIIKKRRNLGIDSTTKEIETAVRKIINIENKIKEIDPEYYELYIAIDRKDEPEDEEE